MNIKLSDNIRAYRKAQALTQQQLAEALGVTVGAVYKWEAGLSMPDISLIVELANFFDTSVDALLGYEIKDSKYEAVIARLKECYQSKDMNGLAEADKALIRYPNSFEVVHQSAKLYYVFGFMPYDKKRLQRSAELMERSILLIGQNTDPEISELSIYDDIASIYSLMNEEDKAIELLKKHNPCGIFNADIGIYHGYAFDDDSKHGHEAEKYLSQALVDNILSILKIAMGYYNLYSQKGEIHSAIEVCEFMLKFIEEIKEEGKNSFLDKASIIIHSSIARAQIELGDTEGARKSLYAAKKKVEKFDARTYNSVTGIRFVSIDEPKPIYDNLGNTAEECIQKAIKDFNSEELAALWEEIKGHDYKNEEG